MSARTYKNLAYSDEKIDAKIGENKIDDQSVE